MVDQSLWWMVNHVDTGDNLYINITTMIPCLWPELILGRSSIKYIGKSLAGISTITNSIYTKKSLRYWNVQVETAIARQIIFWNILRPGKRWDIDYQLNCSRFSSKCLVKHRNPAPSFFWKMLKISFYFSFSLIFITL